MCSTHSTHKGRRKKRLTRERIPSLSSELSHITVSKRRKGRERGGRKKGEKTIYCATREEEGEGKEKSRRPFLSAWARFNLLVHISNAAQGRDYKGEEGEGKEEKSSPFQLYHQSHTPCVLGGGQGERKGEKGGKNGVPLSLFFIHYFSSLRLFIQNAMGVRGKGGGEEKKSLQGASYALFTLSILYFVAILTERGRETEGKGRGRKRPQQPARQIIPSTSPSNSAIVFGAGRRKKALLRRGREGGGGEN